ncbi:uracil-DNA glycosylase [Saccharicrinis fermentans]|uniref:Type-4 uracil-DNA glycosylase n=1 Tax=Saccharicrinis fermentans DSM 9555 = JCM 21142 TaxID=869213 RepID=W7XZJ6_9BACT|nr:uracil-DNA glycosylase [Saccharicrinis fermentans]GAF04085.1 uracil-DNA glycosylase [Saccharicrinis fermentans DSM 9555 = JCM 21142]
METLKEKIINCKACKLHKTRNHAIWGEGNYNAEIMVIGEAPGADEDRIGRPFVGKSGQLLDKIFEACGFTREHHIFISNIVKCRPPDNRIPTDEEVKKCFPLLLEQINIVNPKIIIPLGATALKHLFNNPDLKITKLRGTWMEWNTHLVMPVFHPSALLRNPNLKRNTWEDFKKIIDKYREVIDANHYSAHY